LPAGRRRNKRRTRPGVDSISVLSALETSLRMAASRRPHGDSAARSNSLRTPRRRDCIEQRRDRQPAALEVGPQFTDHPLDVKWQQPVRCGDAGRYDRPRQLELRIGETGNVARQPIRYPGKVILGPRES
jgi:hypothetical protein